MGSRMPQWPSGGQGNISARCKYRLTWSQDWNITYARQITPLWTQCGWKTRKTNITSQMITKSPRSGTLFFGGECLGFSHKEVGTHSLRSGFSMELFLSREYPEKIMIIGQWLINALLLYIQIQVINISKCIRDLMVSTRTFYTIPEAEFIYYTPGQPGVQPHRINPQQGITYTNTSSLSLPRWNGSQERNTHATFSEISEQQCGKTV